jgi:glycosyltransferase 2 family protein
MHLGKYCSTVIATAVGLGLAVVLVRSMDVTTLRVTVARVGLAVPVVVAVRLAVVALAGLGWAPLVIASRPVSLAVLVGLRFVREAVNVLLPVAAVGGDVVGGRLLTRWSVPAGAAAASILGDLTVQFFTQLLFAALGIVVLAVSGKSGVVVAWASSALGVGVLALAGFFAAQRLGLFRLTEVALEWVAQRWPAASLGNPIRLQESLRATYACPRKVALATALHLAAWLLGTVETFAVLLAIGVAPSLGAALVVESLGQAFRIAGTPVPGALGVQEGGYILLVGLYGMSPEVGLALSLTKRIPDLLIGVAGVIAWLGLEAGHIGPTKIRRAAIAEQANKDVSV